MKFTLSKCSLLFALLCLIGAHAPESGLIGTVHAAVQTAKSTKTANEKRRVEGEKASVEKRISSLEAALSEKEARSEKASAALQKADESISQANRRLRDLRDRKQTVEADIRSLGRDSNSVSQELLEAENTVEQIARAQFLNSRRSAWQTALTGRNPNTLARDAGELRYLANVQNRAVNVLEQRRNNIQKVAQKRKQQHEELAKIQQEEEIERKNLLREKQERQTTLGKLQSEIKTQQAAIDKLKKDQMRLSDLVNSIDARLTKERAAEEKAEAEARRRAQAAAKKSGNAQSARTQTASKSSGTQSAASSYVPQSGKFGKLRGLLSAPVKGAVIGNFGQVRAGQAKGAVWQGMQFRAAEGTKIVACAPGKIVFSNWLRGFGNLVIIDHGDTYMSIYANNEENLKSVGQSVKQGETIATVGSSGGAGEPGLYFELRYKGKPINPAPWLKK